MKFCGYFRIFKDNFYETWMRRGFFAFVRKSLFRKLFTVLPNFTIRVLMQNTTGLLSFSFFITLRRNLQQINIGIELIPQNSLGILN